MIYFDNFFKQFLLKNYSNRTLLERRVIKIHGEDYNSSYLKLLRETNPSSYKRLGKLMAIAVRKNKRDFKKQRNSEIENLLEDKNSQFV